MKNTEIVIRKYFIEKGFLNTTVNTIQTSDTTGNTKDGVGLRFVVDKKRKVKINKISFEGNDNFSDKRLKKTLRNTHEKPRFWLIHRLADQIFKTNPKTVGNFVDSSYQVSNQTFKEFINDNVKLNLLQGSKYIQTDFDEDKSGLIAFYNNKG